MTVYTRIAIIAVGERAQHDEGIGWAVLARLRERAAARPLPPGTRLAECDGEPGRLAGLWENAALAIVVEAARCARGALPGRVHRLELDGAGLRRPGEGVPRGLGVAIELARDLNRLPGRLVAYAVEAADFSVGAGLSAPVAATVAFLVERVEDDIVRHRGAAAQDAA